MLWRAVDRRRARCRERGRTPGAADRRRAGWRRSTEVGSDALVLRPAGPHDDVLEAVDLLRRVVFVDLEVARPSDPASPRRPWSRRRRRARDWSRCGTAAAAVAAVGGCCGGGGAGGAGGCAPPDACASSRAPRAHKRTNWNKTHLANRGLAAGSVLQADGRASGFAATRATASSEDSGRKLGSAVEWRQSCKGTGRATATAGGHP